MPSPRPALQRPASNSILPTSCQDRGSGLGGRDVHSRRRAERRQCYAFMDFMLQPEVIAGCTNYTAYANANLASKPFIPAEILNDPAVYPDEENDQASLGPQAVQRGTGPCHHPGLDRDQTG